MLVASTYLLMDAMVPTAERWIDFEGDFILKARERSRKMGGSNGFSTGFRRGTHADNMAP
jgi:hypothetical protein